VIAAIVAVVLGAALSLGGVGAAATNKTGAKGTIAISIPFHNPWLDPYGKELQRVAKQAGYTVSIQYADATTQTQSSQIDTMIAQHPNLLIYTVYDAKAATGIIAKVKASGVPVLGSIIEPTPAGTKLLNAYYGPNDFIQGSLNAKALVQYLRAHGKRGGEIAIVRGAPGGTDNTDRAAGFRSVLKKYPSYKVVADQNSDWQSDPVAYNVTSAILRQHQNVVGILTEADTIAAGAAKAVKALGKSGQVAITGLGGSCQGFQLIKQKQIVADTLQDPVLGAQGAFQVAEAIINKKPYKHIAYMKLPVLTTGNVSKYTCHW
jgi:ribose transport system substrate-binding protein